MHRGWGKNTSSSRWREADAEEATGGNVDFDDYDNFLVNEIKNCVLRIVTYQLMWLVLAILLKKNLLISLQLAKISDGTFLGRGD